MSLTGKGRTIIENFSMIRGQTPFFANVDAANLVKKGV